MRIFLAGATGVIGRRLVPLLVADGHVVAGMTRTPGNLEMVLALGATPIVCDVFDAERLTRSVVEFGPELVMHQLTDLPDLLPQSGDVGPGNARIRRQGTRNLIAAADAAGAGRLIAQSVAWSITGDGGEAVVELEQMVTERNGVVLRYGQFYGPGTYHSQPPATGPVVHIDTAVADTVEALTAVPGVYTIVDE